LRRRGEELWLPRLRPSFFPAGCECPLIPGAVRASRRATEHCRSASLRPGSEAGGLPPANRDPVNRALLNLAGLNRALRSPQGTARFARGRMCCRERMLREKLHELQGSKGFSHLPPAMLAFRTGITGPTVQMRKSNPGHRRRALCGRKTESGWDWSRRGLRATARAARF
jgi:hypothetical protein